VVGAPVTSEAESEKRRNAESRVDNRLGNILEEKRTVIVALQEYDVERGRRWLRFRGRNCIAIETDGNSLPHGIDRSI
jgi:hypothetical protein